MLIRPLILFSIVNCVCALPTSITRQVQGNSSCDASKLSKLIGSIQETMFIQKQELQGLQTLLSLSTSNTSPSAPVNGTRSDFQLNQDSITSTEQQGIAVRESSQRLADELSSPSAMGLAIVAQSQVAVMIGMKNLQGGGQDDAKKLESMLGMVKTAITQNEQNLKMVDRGCGK